MSFSNLLGKISPSSSRNRSGAKNAPKSRKLRLESLESREMLAVVNTLADVLDPTDESLSLRQAIRDAQVDEVITFAPELIGGTINLNRDLGSLTISTHVTIDAWNLYAAEQNMSVKDHKGITIDGSNLNYAAAGETPMVKVTASNGSKTTTLRGLTFTNSTVNPSTFDHDLDGAAIYASGMLTNLTIQNCAFTDVKYGAGGVVNFDGYQLKIANSLIADNTAFRATSPDNGAAVFVSYMQAYIHNCTIANNAVNSGGNVTGSCGVYASDYTQQVYVYNSIVTGHTSAFRAGTGTTFEVKKSVVEVGSSAVPIDFTNGNNFSYTAGDPLYVNAGEAANGKYWLAKNSQAKNKGSDEYVTVLNGYILTTENNNRGYDLSGNYRRKGSSGAYTVDAGAYAAFEPFTQDIFVTTSSDILDSEGKVDHTDDFCADGSPKTISLRDAYDYIDTYYVGGNFRDFANSFKETTTSDAFKTIKFAADIAGCRLTKELVSTKTYMIIGTRPGAPNVAIRGSDTPPLADPIGNDIYNTDAVRIFNVQAGTITATNLNLKNTLARAYVGDPSTPSGKGGAIYIASDAKYVANGGQFIDNYALACGGAVYVAEGGAFTGSGLYATLNQSFRGGMIANFGNVSLTGVNTFFKNFSGALSENMTSNSFGGAIYNVGTTTIGDAGKPQEITTFTENTSISIQPAPGAQLIGGSGGAIYNTSRPGKTVSLSVYNAVFTGNVSSKYGGAIASFDVLNVQNSTFTNNRAAAGGAIQTSGTTTIIGGAFNQNVANVGGSPLTANLKDFGGNGAAIFAGGASSNLTIQGNVSFAENDAKNAGGAIDYINGTLTFDGATVTFNKNKADVIGGAIVATGPIAFSNAPTFTFGAGANANTAGKYAPNVAVTCNVGDAAISNMANAFFDGPTTRDKLDTFIRYGNMLAGTQLTFAALAQSFTTAPTELKVKIDSNAYATWDSTSYANLAVGPHIVLYYETNNPDVVFRANIRVIDANTSVVFSQIDLSERAFLCSPPPGEIPAGVSLRVYSTAANPIPVNSWTITWDTEGGTSPVTINRFGFTLNAFHFYGAAGTYKVSLSTTDSSGVRNYGYVGDCVVQAPASAAVLQEELFADENLLDELFIEF
jgi:hypothetical protein